MIGLASSDSLTPKQAGKSKGMQWWHPVAEGSSPGQSIFWMSLIPESSAGGQEPVTLLTATVRRHRESVPCLFLFKTASLCQKNKRGIFHLSTLATPYCRSLSLITSCPCFIPLLSIWEISDYKMLLVWLAKVAILQVSTSFSGSPVGGSGRQKCIVANAHVW